MFAVIFEVQPRPDRFDDYLDTAKALRPALEAIDGFIDNERFRSETTRGHILSLSTWRDEKALIRWRTLAIHHAAQEKGRFDLFDDYHLRVGEVIADTRDAAGTIPSGQRLDATEIGLARIVTLSERPPRDDAASSTADLGATLGVPEPGRAGSVAAETFASITDGGKLLLLASWQDEAQARAWLATQKGGARCRHRMVRVIRDYGLVDRREAPQYYPPVTAEKDSQEPPSGSPTI